MRRSTRAEYAGRIAVIRAEPTLTSWQVAARFNISERQAGRLIVAAPGYREVRSEAATSAAEFVSVFAKHKFRVARGWPLSARLGLYIGPREPNGCRLWTGGTDDRGYALLTVDGWSQRVSRLLLGLGRGDLDALHSCDNPSCVEQTHLRAGTAKENMADKLARGRDFYRSKTHCMHGHVFDLANTHLNSLGQRSCRTCCRFRMRRKRAEAKGRLEADLCAAAGEVRT